MAQPDNTGKRNIPMSHMPTVVDLEKLADNDVVRIFDESLGEMDPAFPSRIVYPVSQQVVIKVNDGKKVMYPVTNVFGLVKENGKFDINAQIPMKYRVVQIVEGYTD